MNLRVEQRALAQSDQENVVVLGPNPADENFSSVSTEGAYKILGVRPGLTISVFDMVIGADFVGRFSTEPCVAIDFLFEASGQGWLLGAADERLSSIPYRPGRIYIMAAPKGAIGLYDVPIGTRFKGLDIRVDIALWQKLGAADVLSSLDENHSLHMACGNGTWVGILPVPPQLLAVARALFDSAMLESDDLAFEARALDIINASISAMRRAQPTASIPPRDRRLLQRARDLMIAELAKPWTLSELAREAALDGKAPENRLQEHLRLRCLYILAGAEIARGTPVDREWECKRNPGSPCRWLRKLEPFLATFPAAVRHPAVQDPNHPSVIHWHPVVSWRFGAFPIQPWWATPALIGKVSRHIRLELANYRHDRKMRLGQPISRQGGGCLHVSGILFPISFIGRFLSSPR